MQDLLVYIIIALSVVYTVYVIFFKKKKEGAICDGCASCPAKKMIISKNKNKGESLS